jgi:hypothetical protein
MSIEQSEHYENMKLFAQRIADAAHECRVEAAMVSAVFTKDEENVSVESKDCIGFTVGMNGRTPWEAAVLMGPMIERFKSLVKKAALDAAAEVK